MVNERMREHEKCKEEEDGGQHVMARGRDTNSEEKSEKALSLQSHRASELMKQRRRTETAKERSSSSSPSSLCRLFFSEYNTKQRSSSLAIALNIVTKKKIRSRVTVTRDGHETSDGPVSE